MTTATRTRSKDGRASNPSPWVSAVEGARLLGRGVRALERLAEAGHVRRHDLPGLAPRYHRDDVLKFAPPA